MLTINEARETFLKMEHESHRLRVLAYQCEESENAIFIMMKAIQAQEIAEHALVTCQHIAAETAPWN